MSFNTTHAVVSGGASGLGLAVVERIVSQGGKAAILDINESQGNIIEKKYPGQVFFYKTDISNEQHVESGVQNAVNQFGYINLAEIGRASCRERVLRLV